MKRSNTCIRSLATGNSWRPCFTGGLMTAGNSKTFTQDAPIRGPLSPYLRLRKETALADSPLLSGPLPQASQGNTTQTVRPFCLTWQASALSVRSRRASRSTAGVSEGPASWATVGASWVPCTSLSTVTRTATPTPINLATGYPLMQTGSTYSLISLMESSQ